MLLRVRYLEELAKDIYGGGKGSIRTAPEPMSDRECNRVNGFGSGARRAMITIVKQLQMCEERTPQRGQDPMKLERRTGGRISDGDKIGCAAESGQSAHVI